MISQKPAFSPPKGLVCGDDTAFAHKITRFAAAGTGKLHIVYDFDRTLTVSHPETQEDVTTWRILGRHLSAAGQVRYQRLF